MDSLPRSDANSDSHEVGAFEGMFAKRGVEGSSDDQPTGVFDEMFVRRGRWRKNQTTTSVQHLAENVVSEIPHDEYPVPSLLDTPPEIKKLAVEASEAQFVVKNTFIDSACLDYDSLREFLPERKFHSCPIEDILCRSSSIDDEAALPMCAGIMNTSSGIMKTDSTFARGNSIDHEAALEEMMRTASTVTRGLSVDNEAAMFNTASTAGGVDTRFFAAEHPPLVHASVLAQTPAMRVGPGCGFEEQAFDVACGSYELPWPAGCFEHKPHAAADFPEFVPNKVPHQEVLSISSILDGEKTDPTRFMEQQVAAEQCSAAEKLKALRMRGSQIQQKIAINAAEESEIQDQSFASWHIGAVTLLIDDNLQQPKQMYPPSHDAPAFDASAEAPTLPPCPPPPTLEMGSPAAPVIRLADSLPPPEIRNPSTLSIGSMLHHKGECRPCAFYHTRGCENKEACEFCHICGPGEQKKRLKQHRLAKRNAKIAAMLAEKASLENGDDQAPSVEGAVPSVDEVDADVIIE